MVREVAETELVTVTSVRTAEDSCPRSQFFFFSLLYKSATYDFWAVHLGWEGYITTGLLSSAVLQLPPPFYSWSQLFEKWITLSTAQITTQWITQVVFQILIRWIVIYTMDSAIQRLNNAGLDEATSLLFF